MSVSIFSAGNEKDRFHLELFTYKLAVLAGK